jgi:hypothetical protein
MISPAGFDSGWVLNNTNLSVAFTTLTGGQNYTVAVQAECVDNYATGPWSSSGSASYTTYGNAIAANLLSGKTATTDTGYITGTMTNKVGSSTVITPSTANQAIPQGYYGGVVADGKVSGDANLVAANIKSGVSIFGVAGSLNPGNASSGSQTFTAGGTFTVPAGIYTINMAVTGGGGAAGAGNGTYPGGGGGGGGTGIFTSIATTPGATFPVVIGAGGATSTAAGGNSSVGGTRIGNGGSGGSVAGISSVGGAGGSASGTSLLLTSPGGRGAGYGAENRSYGGYSFYSAMQWGNGLAGVTYGGGGSSWATNGTFGAGAAGKVVIWW